MKHNYFNNEPPPSNLNLVNKNDHVLGFNNLLDNNGDNKEEIFTSYIFNIKRDICLPKNLKEHIIIEYTATFVNLEGDVVEFYSKLDNDLLMQFPFLHVDHPLHEYYEYVKVNTKKRMINVCPNLIPTPLKKLLQYVYNLEQEKNFKNEIKTNILKEKQLTNLNATKEKTRKQKQKEKDKENEKNQSYLSLFMKHMQSDEENDEENDEASDEVKEQNNDMLIKPEEIDKLIEQISNESPDNSFSFIHLLVKCIDKIKYLQYGSMEYNYFRQKISKVLGDSDNEPSNVS
ncbi:conserved protein, unknown function, partial [Hepatocystis sp. ex Piliocolobus tephrosceles]